MRLPSIVARAHGCLGGFFSKFHSYDKFPIPVLGGLVAVGALTLLSRVSFADDAAGQLHFLPFIIDGDGVQSRLIITNVSDSTTHCSLDFNGPDLGTDRFEDHFLVTTDDTRATFELEQEGGALIWAGKGEQTLTYGYARLDCAEPVSARVLYSAGVAGGHVATTSAVIGRKTDEFQFALVPQLGSLELVVANDVNPEASCEIELTDRSGSALSEGTFTVPEMTSVFQTIDELIQIPGDFTEGAVRISCDQEVGAIGFVQNGGVFTALSPTVFPPVPATGPDDANRLVLLPFVMDGDGVRSRLIVTSISDSAGHCSLDVSGPDLVATGSASANFELAENGGNLIWTSKGEPNQTFGYARLECTGPVAAQVLYSANAADELVSLASMAGERKADRFQFTLIPQSGSLALVVANDQATAASCRVELETPYGSTLSETSISVPAMTSVLRMADELFRIPADYTAGAVRVSCDREVAATGLLFNSGLFSVLPPVALAKPMIGITGGEEATEGGDVVFTITATASSARDMTVSLVVRETGGFVDSGELGEKQLTLPAGSTSVDYIVSTIDDSEDKVDGAVTITINPTDGYMVSEIEDSAQVAVRDNDEPAPVSQSPEPESEPEPEPEPDSEPEPDPPPRTLQPPPPPQPEPPTPEPPSPEPPSPEPRTPKPTPKPATLAVTSVSLQPTSTSGRKFLVLVNVEPEGAELTSFNVDWEPYTRGRIFDMSLLPNPKFQIWCRGNRPGNLVATLTTWSNHRKFEDSVTLYCE